MLILLTSAKTFHSWDLLSKAKEERTSDAVLWGYIYIKTSFLDYADRRNAYPITPLLGGLLLNWRVFLCLNLGGPLCGDPGPVALRGALQPVFASGLGTSKFILVQFELLYRNVMCQSQIIFY